MKSTASDFPKGDEADSLESVLEELAWAVLDGRATANEIKRLEELIASSDEAQRVYFKCVRLEAELSTLFTGQSHLLPRQGKIRTAA